jgi:hypothetical protein
VKADALADQAQFWPTRLTNIYISSRIRLRITGENEQRVSRQHISHIFRDGNVQIKVSILASKLLLQTCF